MQIVPPSKLPATLEETLTQLADNKVRLADPYVMQQTDDVDFRSGNPDQNGIGQITLLPKEKKAYIFPAEYSDDPIGIQLSEDGLAMYQKGGILASFPQFKELARTALDRLTQQAFEYLDRQKRVAETLLARFPES